MSRERARTFLPGDALLVARFELAEAVRTRRIVAMMLLFTLAGGLSAWGFSRLVERVEAAAAEALAAPTTARPGATLQTLQGLPVYRDLLKSALGHEAAEYLAALPPMVIFFAWMALLFTPWLVLFTAADAIAAEVGNRSIRYTLLRTGHLEYACGKFLGQAALFTGVIGLAGVAYLAVSSLTLVNPRGADTALGILAFWPRLTIHALPFLALALLASSVANTPAMGWVLSLGGGIGLAIVPALTQWERLRTGPVAAELLDLVGQLVPFGHGWAALGPPTGALFADLARSMAQAVLYLAAAYALLRRRDL